VNIATQDIWLQYFLTELGIHFHRLTIIWCYNSIKLKLCRDPVQRKQTKHIEVHMHFINGKVHDGVTDMKFFPSLDHIVDIFTKIFTEQRYLW
jgi:hypothetical protein